MKKSILTLSTLLCLFLFHSFLASAEDKTRVMLQRNIELKDDSQTKEVKIAINEKECEIDLRISSKVQEGKVTIEIYSPNGKKQGNFSVGCEIQSDASEETVNGEISKQIENPELGDWKIKIIPKKAVGKVTINYYQKVIEKTSDK